MELGRGILGKGRNMTFDSVTAVLVKLAAIIRRVMPRPYAYLSALRATWGRHSYFRTTGTLRSAALGRPVTVDGAGEAFDVVLIDGRDRINCMRRAVPRVGTAGVIIFDDSQRDQYSPALDNGTDAGFRRLDFPGLSPTGVRESTTTLFYRADNCLGI